MTPIGTRAAWLPYALLAGVFMLVKLVCFFWLNPIGDEAYYWLWGQHPDWSYFDHPPLAAWLFFGVEKLFGWNLLSLRLLNWLTFGGTLAIFWAWARRLAPEDPATFFWRATAIYLAAPLFLGMSTIAFNDHLVIFLVIASAHAMLLYAQTVEDGRPRHRWIYLSAVLLGLGVLSKYNAMFLGLGFALFFLVHPPLRKLYASPHTYAAGLLSILIQLPVLGWNLANSFASYGFHVSGRWETALRFDPVHLLLFLVITTLVVSPVVLYAVIRYCVRRPAPGFEARARALAVSTFLVSSLSMLVLSSFAQVFFYWNIVAFILMMPLLPLVIRQTWVFAAHAAYGLIMAALLLVNQFYAPVLNLSGTYDWTISSTFGWDQIGREVEAARATHNADFVGATRYSTAAQLGFAIRDADVVALSTRPDQFDLWFDPAAHTGQTAIFVADAFNPIDHAATYFETVTPLTTVSVESFGHVVFTPTLYLMEGFRDPGAVAPR